MLITALQLIKTKTNTCIKTEKQILEEIISFQDILSRNPTTLAPCGGGCAKIFRKDQDVVHGTRRKNVRSEACFRPRLNYQYAKQDRAQDRAHTWLDKGRFGLTAARPAVALISISNSGLVLNEYLI